MPHIPPSHDPRETAAAWLAKRDRGLSPEEQDAYLEWLQADPRHAQSFHACEKTFGRMMRLGQWQPAFSSEPNPHLFDPAPVDRRRRWKATVTLASALVASFALIMAIVFSSNSPISSPTEPPSPFLRVQERLALEDGTLLHLKDGTDIDISYTETERRVRLSGGEVYFDVAHDASRPFLVETGGVVVQVIGTVFNIRLDHRAVDVLVTSGQVRVSPNHRPDEADPLGALLSAGERSIVSRMDNDSPSEQFFKAEVTSVSQHEIETTLQWKIPLLQFHETPLRQAVTEFNRHNPVRIVIQDERLARTRIGGSFRIDNVRGFIRSLEITLQLQADEYPDEVIILRAGHL